MPQSTDLVTDLPADFEVFGQAVATSMADLLGGASGYILSKASATDMDFAWIANDQGDITGVTATSPLTGGGSSGAITVGIQASSTSQSGAVQLSDSTSTTSSVLAATPTAVKSAYDLAAAAIPKSTVTTNGDIIYSTGSSAVTRLGIGSTGQVLTVAAGVPSWATSAADTNGLKLIKTQTIGTTVSTVTVTDAFSTTYDNYLITIIGGSASTNSTDINIKFGSATTGYKFVGYYMVTTSATMNTYANNTAGNIACGGGSANGMASNVYVMSPFLAARTAVISQTAPTHSDMYRQEYAGFLDDATSYTSFIIAAAGTTLTGGTIRVYGYQKS